MFGGPSSDDVMIVRLLHPNAWYRQGSTWRSRLHETVSAG